MPVDDQIANLIVAQSSHLDYDPDKDISIYINSPGGIVYAGLAIYDTMQFSLLDVQTTCAQRHVHGSSHPRRRANGRRCCTKILIHQGSAGFHGQPTDIEIQAREVINLNELMEEIGQAHRHDLEKVAKVDMTATTT